MPKKIESDEPIINTSVNLFARDIKKLEAYTAINGLTKGEMIRKAVSIYVEWLDFIWENGVECYDMKPPNWFDREDYE